MLTILSKAPCPVDMGIARKYFRLYDNENDSVIQLMLDAALTDLERYTRQTFSRTRYQWTGKLKFMNRWLFPKFPVLELVEVYSIANATAVDLADLEFDEERTPPQLSGVMPSELRITWEAGFDVMPADVRLLLLERAYEAFENPGSGAKFASGATFNPQHKLVLQGYCTEHDAVR